MTTALLVEKVNELYENRQKYFDAMDKSGQMDSIPTIMELIKKAAGV